jgi:hypothetical protein
MHGCLRFVAMPPRRPASICVDNARIEPREQA